MNVRSSVMIGWLCLSVAPSAAVAQERPHQAGREVAAPQVVRDVKPNYTAAARKERIEGSVLLEAVVKEDGTVGEVNVTKSLDTQHGLDEEAVKAMKQWTFKPGMKDGKAAPVAVDVEMTFTLK